MVDRYSLMNCSAFLPSSVVFWFFLKLNALKHGDVLLLYLKMRKKTTATKNTEAPTAAPTRQSKINQTPTFGRNRYTKAVAENWTQGQGATFKNLTVFHFISYGKVVLGSTG